MQANFGYQVKSFSKGSLYVETPFVFVWSGSGTVSGVQGNTSVDSIDHSSWYILPGMRWRIPTGTAGFVLYGVAAASRSSMKKMCWWRIRW